MNLPSKKDDPNDYFEQMKDQVLTYDLLQDDLPKIVFNGPKNSHTERYKLQLLRKDEAGSTKEPDWKGINKNINKISSTIGKIIPVGSAIFKSNFQCGNISNVVLAGPNTYQIDLEKQTNSNRISNWFYFSVEGIKGEANFIIKGFTKSSSLYNEGMKICYREISEISKWRRGGTKISYTNSIEDDDYKSTYQLRFSFFFKSNEPTCIQFACCFPYGLKKLYTLINQIKHNVTYSVLCKTFQGLDLPLLTIGNSDSKEVIVISARVHPGETVSSFIAEGFLKQLTAQGEYGSLLRENFLFKVVPMLNPDGVIKGNYRFSGYGCDLNRKWKVCKWSTQPEVFYMKEMIKNCNKDKKVIMYIDIHGHSRQKNVFFYGCYEGSQSQDPNPNLKPMQFPYLMEKLFQAYKFEKCSFNIGKDKQGTARVTMWRELKIDYVYTLQATFCGPEYGTNYLQSDYQKVGKKLCEGIAVLFHQKLTKQSVFANKGLQRLLRVKQKVFTQLNDHPELLLAKAEDQVGSESEPDAGQIPDKDRNPQTSLPKPDLLFRHVKKPHKTKKNILPPSINTYNFVSFKQDIASILHSESSFKDRVNTNRKTQNNTDIEQVNEQQSLRRIKGSQFDVELNDFLNIVQMPDNKSLEMHRQRNIRLYSLNRNADRQLAKEFKHNPSTQFCRDEGRPQPQSRISHRESLLHGREGAQYRRVRKLAQQSSRKEQSVQVVQQLQGSQLYMSRLEGGRGNAIAPRFYPVSQQKSRRVSLDIYLRKNREQSRNANRRELNFRCTGTEIAKYKSER